MNLVEFLKDLSQQDVEFWVDGDRLRYRGFQRGINSYTVKHR